MGKARILVVEDSLIVAFHLRKTLEQEGYVVTGTESSGEDALKSIQKETPDLVLMDIMLAGKMDGIETAMTIKSKFRIPVIFLTALSDQDTIQRAKITEPFGYIMKPFEDREVFTVVEMSLYKHEIDQRLRSSEEKYFSTIRSISDAVITVDPQYRILYMNPRAEEVTGWRLNETHGFSAFDIIQLKDHYTEETSANPFQITITPGVQNAMPDNFSLISKAGNEIPVEGSISSVIDSKNKFSGLVLIMKDVSEKMAHEKLLKEVEKQHMAALLEGQEQERSRIAKDLHDGLGQMLNALKMKIRLDVADGSKVSGLYTLIDEAIQESIRISENILPAKLKDFDLATCLRSLCNGISTDSVMPVYFESFSESSSISQALKVNLYRIAQEAISNAIKHSQASMISVQLNEDQDMIQLTIEDDGKGFRTGTKFDSSHHGLANMRERAEIMGGTFTIESDPERGTLIIVETPLISNNKQHAKA